jgi:hypothetical protein
MDAERNLRAIRVLELVGPGYGSGATRIEADLSIETEGE